MILDTKQIIASGGELSADVAVVGGGTIGLFLAKQLVDRGMSVVVIESGGRVPSTALNESNAQSVGREHDGTTLGRASGLGGTSALWGGQLVEFDPHDFDCDSGDWGEISASEIADYYRRTYTALGLPEHPGAAYARKKFGGEISATDDTLERFFTAWLPITNFAVLYSQMITEEKALVFLLNTTVNSMQFEGGNALHLIGNCDGTRVVVKANDFVFAAGTLGISRLCLHIKNEPGCPWARNELVGRNFHDHLGCRIATAHVLDEQKFRAYFENGWLDGVKLQPKLRFSAQTRPSVASGVSGFFIFDSEVGTSIANLKLLIRSLRAGVLHSSWTSLPSDLAKIGPSLLRLAWRFICDRRILAVFDKGIGFYIQAEQLQNVESYIGLSNDKSCPDGLPQVRVCWQLAGNEASAIRKFVECADSYLKDRDLARLQINYEPLVSFDPYLKGFRDTYHQGGGMCIGSSRQTGAIDSNCKIWDTENVYVAGAAAFPVASHANSTFTALALALRLADRIETTRCLPRQT
ncbi:MAG: hypothetical protein ING66_16385 [Rhodocyclaceae bacterium]|nr:hypothetical protein [Rhodocyclaceae bacterium]MCA3059064.1 hypothetical protein [Rhodocyclaceae bacterium]MCA3082440.1 hypothetical protein [Rhodocyclaceae bacterium]MCE2723088.1 GMC oxidoreductase [Betaproteobacteria bacterium]